MINKYVATTSEWFTKPSTIRFSLRGHLESLRKVQEFLGLSGGPPENRWSTNLWPSGHGHKITSTATLTRLEVRGDRCWPQSENHFCCLTEGCVSFVEFNTLLLSCSIHLVTRVPNIWLLHAGCCG